MVGWGLKAFIVIMLLCVLMVQLITATALMEEIQKLRGEQGIIWKNQKKLMLKQLDTIQTTGNIQNEQLKVVLKQLVERIEQEKKVLNTMRRDHTADTGSRERSRKRE